MCSSDLSHLDFAGELLATSLELKVVFAERISELNQVAFVELPLVMEGMFVGGANIASEVTRVLFPSVDFKDDISQVFNHFLEFEIHE